MVVLAAGQSNACGLPSRRCLRREQEAARDAADLPPAASDDELLLINIWSGPRSLSTAMMYAWAQRPDCEVVDEPLQAHFFRTHPEKPRPYRELVLSAQDSDGDAVVEKLLDAASGPRIRMVKHIAKQSRGLQQGSPIFTCAIGSGRRRRSLHAILVRSPEELLPSFAKVLPATLDETSYTDLTSIYSMLASEGRAPPVILASDLEADPESTLRSLCAALSVGFEPRMLSWSPGPKPYDGVWAPWWYASAHASSGWGASGERKGMANPEKTDKLLPGKSRKVVPLELQDLLAECGPLFATLQSNAMQILPSTPTSTLKEEQDAETSGGQSAAASLVRRFSFAGA